MSTLEPRSATEPDRRRERRNVNLQGYIIRDGGISEPIELIDLNYGGCGIRIGTELKSGDAVQLTVLGRGSIPAEVRWFSDGRAGLDFTPSINAGRKQVPRRTDREDVTAEANLRMRGRNSFRVRVFDLSSDGCRVEVVELPKVHDGVSIKFDGLEVLDAEICWVEAHQAGLMFENRIHPVVLELLLARLGDAG